VTNVVRLVNGGSIQVKTGVIQGIGPIGPMGLTGQDGPQGPAGAQGDPGPMGQILQSASMTIINTSNAISANTDTQLTWGSNPYDDLGCFSGNNCTLSQIGDYNLSVWVAFADAAAGSREIWMSWASNTNLLARCTRQSVAGAPFYVDLSFVMRVGPLINLPPLQLNVYARSSQATSISVGSWSAARLGSGPMGLQGVQGPKGDQGIQGLQGNPGTTSAPSTPYANYGALHT